MSPAIAALDNDTSTVVVGSLRFAIALALLNLTELQPASVFRHSSPVTIRPSFRPPPSTYRRLLFTGPGRADLKRLRTREHDGPRL